MVIAFNKPYGAISEFHSEGASAPTLADFNLPSKLEVLGRLDADAEGLLLLSDVKELNERLVSPRHCHPCVYWVQVERIPSETELNQLRKNAVSQSFQKLYCRAWPIEIEPDVPARIPPLDLPQNMPTSWIGIKMSIGTMRQVRRMTASIGHPALRLMRVQIGDFALNDLKVGKWRKLTAKEKRQLLEDEISSTVPWRHKHAGARLE